MNLTTSRFAGFVPRCTSSNEGSCSSNPLLPATVSVSAIRMTGSAKGAREEETWRGKSGNGKNSSKFSFASIPTPFFFLLSRVRADGLAYLPCFSLSSLSEWNPESCSPGSSSSLSSRSSSSSWLKILCDVRCCFSVKIPKEEEDDDEDEEAKLSEASEVGEVVATRTKDKVTPTTKPTKNTSNSCRLCRNIIILKEDEEEEEERRRKEKKEEERRRKEKKGEEERRIGFRFVDAPLLVFLATLSTSTSFRFTKESQLKVQSGM